MVAMSQVCKTSSWDRNLHLILTQNITQVLCKNDCWICTQRPTSGQELGLPLIGIPLPNNISWTSPKIWSNTTLSKDPPSTFTEIRIMTENYNKTHPCIISELNGTYIG